MRFGRQAIAERPSRAEKRISGMATHALMDWLDIAVMGLGRAASDARRDDNSASLVEIEEGAEVVRLVAAELQRRA